ncbi:response regulator transcription factor [Yersinia enterocolitica]|jgi:DNA-binding NarL/FixJ family response regulator|uniref:Nitrate/nitrite response regulator protein n=1 Tax=Yersinia frederiksenii TaxID=29484 RepID=A0AAI8ZT39_YERFR|nr:MULTISPECIES: LuxR C-terminal-related transcriptional regulator [Yersinia]MDN0126955.1 LuxR C-terminal-related transcriptional regulator [Yersinia massiliensis]CFR07871.1 nitrate/nitrite response regulator protein [Yersinia frederiksenii]CQH47961.1 nitrate/nitrite response regulator protein [Yersinia frederiksenii]HEI6965881.1 response regulator transcription factor [Yersinia enterocolitica]
MKNVTIFSQHGLVRFYLKQLIERFSHENGHHLEIKVFHCLKELEGDLEGGKGEVIIADMDGLSKLDKFRFVKFSKIKRREVFIFTKDNPLSSDYIDLMAGSPSFIMNKSESQDYIEKSVYNFVFNHKLFMKKNNKIDESQENRLTKRENDIFELMLSGLSNKDISKRLFISDKTVSVHKQNIHKKYQTKNLIELYLKVN